MAIVQNRRAVHDYSIEERFEAGLSLQGWEVKSTRAGQCQLNEAYVIVKEGELFLLNAHIGTLPTTSTHEHADPTRTRKLLRARIDHLLLQLEKIASPRRPRREP